MVLSDLACQDLLWWEKNLFHAFRPISMGNPDVVLYSDASNLGYGSTADSGISGQGLWKTADLSLHINFKKLTAAMSALMALCRDISGKHVRILCDNHTAVTYINE